MYELMQTMLHMPLDLQKETREPLKESNLALRMEQILFVDVRNIRMHKMRGQNQF